VTAEDTARAELLNQLAYYWQTLNETTQWYFEQLYALVPKETSEVLAGVQLPRTGERPSLQSWIESQLAQQGGETDMSSTPIINVATLTVQPAKPAPNERFTVQWTGHTSTDFPPRQDQVTICDMTNNVVADQVVLNLKADAGPVTGQVTFEGLPTGNYAVYLTVNLEGSDDSYIDRQGLRTEAGAELFVGDTREGQVAADAPIFAAAVGSVLSCASADSFSEFTASALAEAANGMAGLDQLGPGFRSELSRIADLLGSGEVCSDRHWIPLRDQLMGIAGRASVGEPGTFATRFIEIVDEIFEDDDEDDDEDADEEEDE
jgi:hypothetical protein